MTTSFRIGLASGRQQPAFSAAPPLSLYIHVPWCERKCPYCDFNSHAIRGPVPEAGYIDALAEDLEHDLPSVWGRPVNTVFIGGGTPSLLQPESVDRLLSEVRARLPLRPGAEITMEANPGTLGRGRAAAFRASGITRLSIGIQSLNDTHLARLGRTHDAAEARKAAEEAAAAGFDHWNIDLMYGLPGQSVAEAGADLRAALELGAPHLSHYQLTFEPDTPFHRRPPRRADDDAIWAMQEQSRDLLREAGYRQYEVSAWARPGHEGLHNLNYWQFGDYLGIGAGAHAKVTNVSEQAVRRASRTRDPADYLRLAGARRIAQERLLGPDDLLLEFLMNALRLTDGFDRALLQERTGLPVALAEPSLSRAEQLGLIGRDHLRIWATERGQHFLNDLLLLFVPSAAARAPGPNPL